jgi:hypothetical protein
LRRPVFTGEQGPEFVTAETDGLIGYDENAAPGMKAPALLQDV